MVKDKREDLAAIRRRLRYRAWRRGTREMDLLLGRFADSTLDEMDRPMLALFEVFLNQPDPAIYDWLTGIESAPPGGASELTGQIMRFHKGSKG